ncbi:hypothetical protein IV203_002967 [Nitzschia inconspicua]|uniref:DUF6824 domain-containing protein n=1 Tax=Nitzschia inconspicua TaxID=303405 RepID=A0A9K3L0Z3_9STRA|nr:hypothetical protein IV203_002967 [Nitzschia inconspicua]
MPINVQETSPTSVMVEEGDASLRGETGENEANDDDDSSAALSKQRGGKSKKASGYTSKEPHEQDVLLGRGKPVQAHPGNQHMLSLIHHYREEYDRIGRSDKYRIIEDIMGRIQARGGRFMEYVQDKQHWEEVSRAAAYNKVSHAFRSLRRANLPPEQKKRAHSETSRKSRPDESMAVLTGFGDTPVGVFPPLMNSTIEGYDSSAFPPMPVMGTTFDIGVPAWGTDPTDFQPTYWTQSRDPEGIISSADPLTVSTTDATTSVDTQNICAV